MEAVLDFLGIWGVIIIGCLLILIAYIGSIIPALPGSPFALAAVLLVHFALPANLDYSWITLAIVITLTIAISFVDYFVPIWGTKKFGGSKHGVRGSTFGLIIGALISFFSGGIGIVALFAGPFVGAYIGEIYFAKAEKKVALRSAWGSLMGFLAGTIGKLVVVSILAVVFVIGITRFF